MIRRALALLALLLLALATPAAADEFRPTYLQLTQTGGESCEGLWKSPALDEYTPLKVRPVFPADDPLTCVARGGGKALEMMDQNHGDFFATN